MKHESKLSNWNMYCRSKVMITHEGGMGAFAISLQDLTFLSSKQRRKRPTPIVIATKWSSFELATMHGHSSVYLELNWTHLFFAGLGFSVLSSQSLFFFCVGILKSATRRTKWRRWKTTCSVVANQSSHTMAGLNIATERLSSSQSEEAGVWCCSIRVDRRGKKTTLDGFSEIGTKSGFRLKNRDRLWFSLKIGTIPI